MCFSFVCRVSQIVLLIQTIFEVPGPNAISYLARAYSDNVRQRTLVILKETAQNACKQMRSLRLKRHHYTVGFEPTTRGLRVRCYTKLSYSTVAVGAFVKLAASAATDSLMTGRAAELRSSSAWNKAPFYGGIRTHDTRISRSAAIPNLATVQLLLVPLCLNSISYILKNRGKKVANPDF